MIDFAFADSANGAYGLASAASNAFVGNNVSHNNLKVDGLENLNLCSVFCLFSSANLITFCELPNFHFKKIITNFVAQTATQKPRFGG